MNSDNLTLLEIITKHTPANLDDFVEQNIHIIDSISNYLENEKKEGNRQTPHNKLVFTGLQMISFDKEGLFQNSLKVVICLQDPYPTDAACGICMASIHKPVQKSLNIFYKRIRDTYKVKDPENNQYCEEDGTLKPITNGDVRGWCSQGILMYNTSLTTKMGETRSHVQAWSQFTQVFIKYLSEKFPFLVFVMLGKDAQICEKYINKNKHTCILSSHPASRDLTTGFHICDIFNQINEILESHMREPIAWEQCYYN